MGTEGRDGFADANKELDVASVNHFLALEHDAENERPNETQSNHRFRRWNVTFGNPALGTYGGSIVTLHRRSEGRQHQIEASDDDSDTSQQYKFNDSDSSMDSFSSSSSFESLLKESEIGREASDGSVVDALAIPSRPSVLDTAVKMVEPNTLNESIPSSNQESINKTRYRRKMQRIAVMTNVPPHQVPDGVLNLVRGHRPFIEHVRIVIGSSRSEEAELRRLRWKRRREKGEKSQCSATKDQLSDSSRTWAYGTDAFKDGVRGFNESCRTTPIIETDGRDAPVDLPPRERRRSSLDILTFLASEEKYDGMNYEGGRAKIRECDVNKYADNDEEEKNYHLLFVLDSSDSADTFVVDLHSRPYTTLDESETCSVYHVAHVEGEDGVSLLGPFFASCTSSTNHESSSTLDDASTLAPNNQHIMDEHQCPVCLEKMSLPSPQSLSTTSVSLITTQLQPGVLSPNAQPPSSSSILTTVCNHSFHIDCLLRWQDSRCPVCRYDHSGLNDTLSRCHVCSNTSRNYVCLICGVVSCASGPLLSPTQPIITNDTIEHPPSAQVPSQRGHALQHYEETLHAYALDTESQHVWDFAGGGYVHRLLQNLEDGKIVEGRDPRALIGEESGLALADGGTSSLSAMERSSVPTYSSSAEDDEAVHRKLEGFAGQYYTLLKSQLEQQRIYYEGRLEAIRREHELSHRSGIRRDHQSTTELVSALKQERNQLEQRCMTLRRKHRKVSDDAMFLKSMNESLEADKLAFRKQIAEARSELAETREMMQQCLPPLEEKVRLLMLQLECDIGGDCAIGPGKKLPAKR